MGTVEKKKAKKGCGCGGGCGDAEAAVETAVPQDEIIAKEATSVAHLEMTLAPEPIAAKDTDKGRTRIGVMKFARAITSGKVKANIQKMRFGACIGCTQFVRDEDGNDTGERLFRMINGEPYCGVPATRKVIRNEVRDGCGCNLNAKTQYVKSECPRKIWGPGASFPGARIVMRTDLEQERIPDFLDVHIMSRDHAPDVSGIGDCLAFLPVVAAIQKANPDRTVRYIVSKGTHKWARLGFSKFEFEENAARVPGELELYATELTFYGMDLDARERGLMTRHAYWENRFGLAVGQMKVKPEDAAKQQIKEDAYDILAAGKPIVALSPFGSTLLRDWPVRHYLMLQKLLKENGVECFVLDGPQANRTQMFDCMRFWGYAPTRTVALMHYAWLHVGNDSSMSHLAGITQTDAIAICSSTIGEHVFGWYDTVEPMQAAAPCTGCYYREEKGFSYPCGKGCNAMWDLKPETVFARVMQKLETVRQARTQ